MMILFFLLAVESYNEKEARENIWEGAEVDASSQEEKNSEVRINETKS